MTAARAYVRILHVETKQRCTYEQVSKLAQLQGCSLVRTRSSIQVHKKPVGTVFQHHDLCEVANWLALHCGSAFHTDDVDCNHYVSMEVQPKRYQRTFKVR